MRAARVSRGIVGLIVVMVIADTAVLLTYGDTLRTSQLVIVGDPVAPGMAAVRAEAEERIADGAMFEPDILGGWIVSAFALIWAITGCSSSPGSPGTRPAGSSARAPRDTLAVLAGGYTSTASGSPPNRCRVRTLPRSSPTTPSSSWR